MMQARGKQVLFGMLLVGCALSTATCGSDGDDSSEDSDPEEGWLERLETPEGDFIPTKIEGVLDDIVDALNQTEPQPDMRIAVINKDNLEYFKIAALGSSRAVSELGIIGNVNSPESIDDQDKAVEEQKALAQQFVDEGYDGMGIAPLEAALGNQINDAVKGGAVVVTFDGDLPVSDRQFYAGTNNREAGKTAGESLVGLLDGTVGTVVILGQEEEVWPDGYNRTMGAKEVIEAAGNTVLIRQADWADPDSNVTAMIELLETAESPPVGMLGVFSNAYLCVEAAEQAGVLDENLKIAAFDLYGFSAAL